MGATKIHLCETCGGHLKVDLEKQIYICPFCGVTYDYEYFKEDDILSKAQTFEERGELDAALDAYKFYLTKDPHNTGVLKRVMLLTHHITDINVLREAKVLADFSSDPSGTKWVVESCDEDSKEFFETEQEIFENAYEYQNAAAELEPAEQEVTKLENKILELDGLIGGQYISYENKDMGFEDHKDPRELAVKCKFLYVMATLFAALLMLACTRSFIGGIIFGLITAGLCGVIHYYNFVTRIKAIEKLEAQKEQVISELSKKREVSKEIASHKDAVLQNIRKLMIKLSKLEDQIEGP